MHRLFCLLGFNPHLLWCFQAPVLWKCWQNKDWLRVKCKKITFWITHHIHTQFLIQTQNFSGVVLYFSFQPIKEGTAPFFLPRTLKSVQHNNAKNYLGIWIREDQKKSPSPLQNIPYYTTVQHTLLPVLPSPACTCSIFALISSSNKCKGIESIFWLLGKWWLSVRRFI